LNQNVIRLDVGLIVDVSLAHMSGDTRAQGIDGAIDLGVVGALDARKPLPYYVAAYGKSG